MDNFCKHRNKFYFHIYSGIKKSYFLFTLYVLNTLIQPQVKVKVTQSCLPLWDPKDWSLPGSSIHGILLYISSFYIKENSYYINFTGDNRSCIYLEPCDLSSIWTCLPCIMLRKCIRFLLHYDPGISFIFLSCWIFISLNSMLSSTEFTLLFSWSTFQ